jgi:hypothetical protein
MYSSGPSYNCSISKLLTKMVATIFPPPEPSNHPTKAQVTSFPQLQRYQVPLDRSKTSKALNRIKTPKSNHVHTKICTFPDRPPSPTPRQLKHSSQDGSNQAQNPRSKSNGHTIRTTSRSTRLSRSDRSAARRGTCSSTCRRRRNTIYPLRSRGHWIRRHSS